MRTLRLNDALVKDFRVVKKFDDHHGQTITSLDFDRSGEFVVTAAQDDSMRLYDLRFNASQVILSKKYGCHLARFTNSQNDLLHTSTKENRIPFFLGIFVYEGDGKHSA